MIHPYRPNLDWSELLEVLRLGAGRSKFESALAAHVGARYGVVFAYGRSGIIAACKALDLTQAEVIMPAYTCRVVAEAVVTSGNRPVFVDIDFADYNMNIRAMKDALTSRTRAIIATHMYGYPADVEAIRAMVGDDRSVIIEDAALLGPLNAGSGGVGLRGDIAVFSFGHGKHLYTVDGGGVVTNSAVLYEKLKAYRDKEMNGLPWKIWAKRLVRLMNGYMMLSASLLDVLDRLNQTGPMRRARDKLGLAHIEMPNDYATAFADFQGRVGLAQLRKFDSILASHRAWAEFYDRELQDIPGIRLAPIIAGATYASYTLRVERRDEIGFRQRIHAKGINIEEGTRFDYALPYMQPYRPYTKGTYPHAAQAAREVVNLPNYAGLSATSARHIVKSIRESCSGPARYY
jgi:perosamine synthetase